MTELICSLDEFRTNAGELARQVKETGDPLVLTVDGEATLVVQDAEAYQKLLDAIDRAETLEGIRKGLQDVEEGRTQPIEEALEEIRARYHIPADA